MRSTDETAMNRRTCMTANSTWERWTYLNTTIEYSYALLSLSDEEGATLNETQIATQIPFASLGCRGRSCSSYSIWLLRMCIKPPECAELHCLTYSSPVRRIAGDTTVSFHQGIQRVEGSLLISLPLLSRTLSCLHVSSKSTDEQR